MKKHTNSGFLLIIFISFNILFSSCLKNFNDEQIEKEKEALRDYIRFNDITEDPTNSGMYFIDSIVGTGLAPVTGDSLWVHFKGELLDGTLVQTTTDMSPTIIGFGIGQVIDGFDEGLSYMKRGGDATFIVPSWLAYGATGYYSIPGYTTLLYRVHLMDDATFDNHDDLAAFLDENQITTPPTASGLYYIETLPGTGDFPVIGSDVYVHYTGMLLDSTVFDTSMGGDPLSFKLGVGEVIEGWDEGIALMKKGGKATLIIPHTLGYGVTGSGTIPPKAYLVFDVELLDQ